MPEPLSRIGLLGDLHTEHEALDLALRVFADRGVDTVMAVGDIVDGRGSVERCCERLAEAGAAVVRGNHERWLLAGTMRDLPDATRALSAEARRFLAALPATRRFAAPSGEILLCHGLGDDDMASVALDADALSLRWNAPLTALIEEDRPLWVLNGHTHHRGVWSYGKLTVVNGGTLFRDHAPCFAIVDLVGHEVTYLDVVQGDRLGRTEVLPLPPPRGARR